MLTSVLFLPIISYSQNIERITFDVKDSKDGYYFAIQPQLKISKGVLVLLSSFMPPGGVLPETKLHTWFMLMICSPLLHQPIQNLYADSSAVNRITSILKDVS